MYVIDTIYVLQTFIRRLMVLARPACPAGAFCLCSACALPTRRMTYTIEILNKLKNKSRDDIINYIETRVKAYLNLSKNIVTLFTTIINLGFGRSVINQILLKKIQYTINNIKFIVIKKINER